LIAAARLFDFDKFDLKPALALIWRKAVICPFAFMVRSQKRGLDVACSGTHS
jgi:hypothetical protein